MNLSTIVIASLLISAAALAGEEHRMKIEIAVDDGGGTPTVIRLDGDDMGFELDDLQEGESRSVVDNSGKMVLVTRTADGFVFDVDGRKIEIPGMHEDHALRMTDDVEEERNIDVRVVKQINIKGDANRDDVTIISGKVLDDSTKEAIRSVLISAGHAGEVKFLDGSELHGGHTSVHSSGGIREIRISSSIEDSVTN